MRTLVWEPEKPYLNLQGLKSLKVSESRDFNDIRPSILIGCKGTKDFWSVKLNISEVAEAPEAPKAEAHRPHHWMARFSFPFTGKMVKIQSIFDGVLYLLRLRRWSVRKQVNTNTSPEARTSVRLKVYNKL